MIKTILSLLGVGILWGATNPFMRLGVKNVKKIDTGSKLGNLWLDIRSAAERPSIWVPFLLNQLGSVLFAFTVQETDMTIAVTVTNSLSFVFTALVGYLLGENLPSKRIIMGTIIVSVGSFLLMYNKSSQNEQAIEIKFTADEIVKEL